MVKKHSCEHDWPVYEWIGVHDWPVYPILLIHMSIIMFQSLKLRTSHGPMQRFWAQCCVPSGMYAWGNAPESGDDGTPPAVSCSSWQMSETCNGSVHWQTRCTRTAYLVTEVEACTVLCLEDRGWRCEPTWRGRCRLKYDACRHGDSRWLGHGSSVVCGGTCTHDEWWLALLFH